MAGAAAAGCMAIELPRECAREVERVALEARVTLDQLGLAAGTDKASNGHGYLSMYEERFEPWVDREFDLMEIGVRFGRSIRVWHAWFPLARIIGIDITPITLEDEDRMPRYIFRRGSQFDGEFLDSLFEEFDPRIVIDDGSHLCDHQIFSFERIFPRLKPGSMYICEDINTSFTDEQSPYRVGAVETAYDYFQRIARHVARGPEGRPLEPGDSRLRQIVSAITSIEVIRHCVIVRN